jgi:recombination protein RecT
MRRKTMSNLPVANKEKLKTFGNLLEARKASFSQVLPQHIKVDRLIRAALLAMSRQPLLLQCTQNSIIQSMMVAAQLGLETDGVLGSAYLVPFRNKAGEYEAQLIPGYRGLIDLARRSGQIKRIEARVVKEKDKFEFHYGLEPILRHVPSFPEDGGNIIAAYAVAELIDGAVQVEVMSKAEIDCIRARSKAKDSGPWVSDYGEMARKTAVRRLIKYLPLSVELARAIEIDNRIESGEDMHDMIDVNIEDLPPELEAPKKKTRTQQIKESLNAPQPPAPPQPDENHSPPHQSAATGRTKGQKIVQTISDDQIDQIGELCQIKGLTIAQALQAEALPAELIELDYDSAADLIDKLAAI